MKSSLLVLVSLLSLQVNAFDCAQFEAQVIGKASIVSIDGDECRVKFSEFSHFNVSQVCPLFIGEVLGNEVKVSVASCQVDDVLELSGVIVRQENEEALQLEE